jgi:hypothetical protein
VPARSAVAAVAEHLDVADRVEAKAARDAALHQLDDAGHRLLGIGGGHGQKSLSASGLPRSGMRPWLIWWALVMILLAAAWRNTSVSRTTGTAPDPMMSASTWPGPTEGSWSMSPTTSSAT